MITPLHLATEVNSIDVVEFLINHKADFNAKDSSLYLLYMVGLPYMKLLNKAIPNCSII